MYMHEPLGHAIQYGRVIVSLVEMNFLTPNDLKLTFHPIKYVESLKLMHMFEFHVYSM